jgi:hypothetical protein
MDNSFFLHSKPLLDRSGVEAMLQARKSAQHTLNGVRVYLPTRTSTAESGFFSMIGTWASGAG